MTDFPSSPVTTSARDAFEAWAASDNRAIQPIEFEERTDDNNHYYESDYDNNAFVGWKAAGLAQTPARQPTEAMLNAARDWSYKKYGKPIGNDAAIGCWQAMLAALTDTSTDQPARGASSSGGSSHDPASPTPGFRLIEEPCEHPHCEFPSCGCEVPVSSIVRGDK